MPIPSNYETLVALLEMGRAQGEICTSLLMNVAAEGHDLYAIFSAFEN